MGDKYLELLVGDNTNKGAEYKGLIKETPSCKGNKWLFRWEIKSF